VSLLTAGPSKSAPFRNQIPGKAHHCCGIGQSVSENSRQAWSVSVSGALRAISAMKGLRTHFREDTLPKLTRKDSALDE
jgi:hypothetical protein